MSKGVKVFLLSSGDRIIGKLKGYGIVENPAIFSIVPRGEDSYESVLTAIPGFCYDSGKFVVSDSETRYDPDEGLQSQYENFLNKGNNE